MNIQLITNALSDALNNLPRDGECADLVYKALCEVERSPEYAPIQDQIRHPQDQSQATQQGRNTEAKTLRDEFAMATLQGWLAKGFSLSDEKLAVGIYQVADTILAERAK